jgi:alpha-glucan, water dikinase
LQAELEKGASVDEIQKKIAKGEIKTKVSKQLKNKQYFRVDRIQRKKRDLMQLINRNAAKNIDQQLADADQQFVDAPKSLTIIERYANAKEEEYDTDSVLNKKTYKLADNNLLVRHFHQHAVFFFISFRQKVFFWL